MKFKFFLFLSLFLSVTFQTFAVNSKPNLSFSQILNLRFNRQWTKLLQEKVYVHTDKPYYSAGEEIWFKAYLVNATTNEPNALSRYVYVELIDKLDSVQYRVKLRKDSLGFAGHIKLKPELPTGYYKLRAYTYWMQNAGSDFFFKKDLFIGNAIDDRISTKISYGIPVDGVIPVILSFSDAVHNPIVGKKVEIAENWDGGSKRKVVRTTGKEGEIYWKIKVAPNDSSKKYMEVSLKDEKYTTNLFLPKFSKDFDVQFFPESGTFLNNSLQTVAFKAIGRDGLSVEVSGKVLSDKNEEICDFSTLNKGMGKFSVQTQPGENYYAIVKSKEGVEKRFELPKTQQSGVVIHLLYNRGKILYEITNNTGLLDKKLYLLLHSRGKVFVSQALRSLEGQISESLLPSGIASFAVVDSLGHTYCERLTFVRDFDFPIMSMQSDKPNYGKREQVNLDFKIKSTQSLPLNGNFSLSVTDSHAVIRDSLSDNIISNLLLTSEIKGFVEDPNSYFVDDKISTREKTDVLMLTQGWRRFNTADVSKGIFMPTKYYMEQGQALSGKVLNLFNAPSKKSNVTMISSYRNTIRLAKTDTLGRYLIDGIEFPDSTTFVLKAKKPKSITDVEIVPDPDDFPKSQVFIPTPLKSTPDNNSRDEYFKMSKEKYYYEGGMRFINLDEVTVKADKKKTGMDSYYSGMADNEITSEMLERNPGTTILNMLYTVPGIQVNGDQVSIRGALGNPMFLVDDIEMLDITEISYLNTNDVESIQIFKGANTAIFGSRGGNGVIAIRLKQGVNLKTPTPISLAVITPFGYQKPAEFYVPKYDLDSVYKSSNPDLRTTIYWNPTLTSDTTGVFHIKFYTADKAFNYSVVVEGISKTGEICHYEGILKRRNE